MSGPEADAPQVRVLVVDDQRLIRDGIASLLGIQPGITVVGTAADGREALDRCVALTPDVVLMDVRMPVLGGIDALIAIRRQALPCRVLMLTTFDDEEYILQALRAGASGYLLKDLPATDLAQAVLLTHAGVDQHDPSVAGRLIAALDRAGANATPTPPAVPLTDRELDVVRLIARGATNREIAAHLYLSEGTVKNHVSTILSRLGLRDRTQAAIYARDHDML